MLRPAAVARLPVRSLNPTRLVEFAGRRAHQVARVDESLSQPILASHVVRAATAILRLDVGQRVDPVCPPAHLGLHGTVGDVAGTLADIGAERAPILRCVFTCLADVGEF